MLEWQSLRASCVPSGAHTVHSMAIPTGHCKILSNSHFQTHKLHQILQVFALAGQM